MAVLLRGAMKLVDDVSGAGVLEDDVWRRQTFLNLLRKSRGWDMFVSEYIQNVMSSFYAQLSRCKSGGCSVCSLACPRLGRPAGVMHALSNQMAWPQWHARNQGHRCCSSRSSSSGVLGSNWNQQLYLQKSRSDIAGQKSFHQSESKQSSGCQTHHIHALLATQPFLTVGDRITLNVLRR